MSIKIMLTQSFPITFIPWF